MVKGVLSLLGLLLFLCSFSLSPVRADVGSCLAAWNQTIYMDKHAVIALMLDATGKSVDDLGKWDQCRDLGKNVAQYCFMRFVLPVAIPPGVQINATHFCSIDPIACPYIGTCIPAACTESDMMGIISLVLEAGPYIGEKYPKLANLTKYLPYLSELVNFQNSSTHFLYDCVQPAPPMRKSVGSILTIGFSFLIVFLVIAGTGLDGYDNHWWPEKVDEGSHTRVSAAGSINEEAEVKPLLGTHDKAPKSKLFEFLVGFSLVRNFKSMIGPSPPGLAFLNGMRAISIMWVILGHSLDYMNYAGVENYVHVITKDVLKPSAMVFPAAEFSVDSFFWLSGFLVAWLTLTELKTKKRINWFLYYFHRIWRLSPAYFYALFFYMFISTHLAEGPMWPKYLEMVEDTCGKYWWTNIIYVNNFIPTYWNSQCFLWGWYLAVDMQLYIIAPVILVLYHKNKIAGWGIVSVLLVATTAMNGYYAKSRDLVWNDQDPHVYMTLVYGKPYTRAGPWLLGIACAFLYMEKRQLTRLVVYVGWFVSAVIMLLCIYGPYTEFSDNNTSNPLASPVNNWGKGSNFMYFTFAKLGWSVALSFLMYSMSMGWGGFVRRFLGAHFFSPLARLTYSTYLFHPIIMFVVYFSHLQYYVYDNFNYAIMFVGELFLSFCVAAVMFLALERPMVNMEKLLIPHKRH
jgi:peptidoglycan/LPS O-acetylase OafA/YrhL